MELFRKDYISWLPAKKKNIKKKMVLRAKSFIEILQKLYRNGELLTCYQAPAFGPPDTL